MCSAASQDVNFSFGLEGGSRLRKGFSGRTVLAFWRESLSRSANSHMLYCSTDRNWSLSRSGEIEQSIKVSIIWLCSISLNLDLWFTKAYCSVEMLRVCCSSHHACRTFIGGRPMSHHYSSVPILWIRCPAISWVVLRSFCLKVEIGCIDRLLPVRQNEKRIETKNMFSFNEDQVTWFERRSHHPCF